MERQQGKVKIGAITGGVVGISPYSEAPITVSDPAGLFDWVGDAANAVGGVVGGAANAVGQAVGGVTDAVGGAIGGATNAVTGAVGGAVDYVGRTVDNTIRQSVRPPSPPKKPKSPGRTRVEEAASRSNSGPINVVRNNLSSSISGQSKNPLKDIVGGVFSATGGAAQGVAGAIMGLPGAIGGGFAGRGTTWGSQVADNLGVSYQSEMAKRQAEIDRRNRENAAAARKREEENSKNSTHRPRAISAPQGAVTTSAPSKSDTPGIVGGFVKGALDFGGAVTNTLGGIVQSSPADIVKGVGDFAVNAPSGALGAVTAELQDAGSWLATGKSAFKDEREKDTAREFYTTSFADVGYNALATPGQVIDLATSVVDVADETFGSGDYERTQYGDMIKNEIFKRDEIGGHVPGSRFGTQADRDKIRHEALDQWAKDVGESHGDVAGGLASFGTELANAQLGAPVVESVMWLGGALGKGGQALSTALASQQITAGIGDALLGAGEPEIPQNAPPTIPNVQPVTDPVRNPHSYAPQPSTVTQPQANTEEYQRQIDEYAQQYAQAQREMDEQYRRDQDAYEREAEAYQRELDRQYQQAQVDMENQYGQAASQYAENSEDYQRAADEYNAAKNELDAQYAEKLAEAQQQVDDYQKAVDAQQQLDQIEYQSRMEEYQRSLDAQYRQAINEAQTSAESTYYPAVTPAVSGFSAPIGNVTAGAAIREEGQIVNAKVNPQEVSKSSGASPALVIGAMGAALLMGAYMVSKKSPSKGGSI